jgi:hypothetical protein
VDSGDQADVDFLRKFVNKHGGGFPSLRSGGLYFLEDLHTSYIEKYGEDILKKQLLWNTSKTCWMAFIKCGLMKAILLLKLSIWSEALTVFIRFACSKSSKVNVSISLLNASSRYQE